MRHIVLTGEQAGVVLGATEPVEVRDEQGRTVARLTPLDPGDVEAIERSKRNQDTGAPGVPSAQVQAHLAHLQGIRESEGMDEAKMRDLLRRMRAGEAV
jgi:hypothetical protein